METQESKSNTSNEGEKLKRALSKSKYVPQLKSHHGDWKVLFNFKLRGNSLYVECECKCGLKIYTLMHDIIRGASTKCKSCNAVKRNLKHGQNCHGNKSYEYSLWQNLKQQRKLGNDWHESFEIFFADLGKRPNENFFLLKKDTGAKHSSINSFWGNRKLKSFDMNLIGKKFGKWTILEPDLLGKNLRWICQCECGAKARIPKYNLPRGISTKCKSCAMKGKTGTHFRSKESIYHIYHGIKRRCYNPSVKCFKHYGGRGIIMCDRWKESFENFLEDMGERPSDSHSVDRINVNGNYCKENCRWATQKEQVANRRKYILLNE